MTYYTIKKISCFWDTGKTKTLKKNTGDKCYRRRSIWRVRIKNEHNTDIMETEYYSVTCTEMAKNCAGRKSVVKVPFQNRYLKIIKRGPEVKPLISVVVETLHWSSYDAGIITRHGIHHTVFPVAIPRGKSPWHPFDSRLNDFHSMPVRVLQSGTPVRSPSTVYCTVKYFPLYIHILKEQNLLQFRFLTMRFRFLSKCSVRR
jgi:hypothetical protein